MQLSDLPSLSNDIDRLIAEISAEAAQISATWAPKLAGSDYAESAVNLAQYLALRHRDLWDLQNRLMAAGLSSMGRAESRVMPTLMAIRRILSLASGAIPPEPETMSDGFFAGQAWIASRADVILGKLGVESPVRLLVTLPSGAAEDPEFALRLANLGVEAVRINCAHDDEATWATMIAHVRAAGAATGRRIHVVMDLPGPKIRTAKTRKGLGNLRLHFGELLAIVRPHRMSEVPRDLPVIESELAAALDVTLVDHRIHIDDGKLSTKVVSTNAWDVTVRIEAGPEERGYKLKPEKGINFPDAELTIAALTDEDRALLPFIARHADTIDFSFVQTPEDVTTLQLALSELRPDDWRETGASSGRCIVGNLIFIGRLFGSTEIDKAVDTSVTLSRARQRYLRPQSANGH